MDYSMWVIIIAVAALVLQAVALLVAGVWVVGQIRATTRMLSANIAGLERSIEALSKWLEKVHDRVTAQGDRLIRVEEWCKNHVEIEQ